MKDLFVLPDYVKTALAVCEANGHEAYLVGGCVRDLLRGVVPADYDIAVSCPPEATEAAFKGFRVIETGMKHGTVTVVIDRHNLELTTFRVDGTYRDGRHPDEVTFAGRLEDDLSRRDFTINAMAYRPGSGVTDLFGGRDDLKKRTVRCVGDPDVRFTEDALRILRALRFSSALDFDIDPGTAEAVLRQSGRLAAVSAERKFAELKKLFAGCRAETLLVTFRPVFEQAIAPLRKLTEEQYICASKAAGKLRDPATALAALLCGLPPEDTEEACRALRTDNAFLRRACLLRANAHGAFETKGQARTFMGANGKDALAALCALREALSGRPDRVTRAVLDETTTYPTSLRELAVNGRDLEEIGVKGPALGRVLNALLSAAAEGEVKNEREELLAKALEIQN